MAGRGLSSFLTSKSFSSRFLARILPMEKLGNARLTRVSIPASSVNYAFNLSRQVELSKPDLVRDLEILNANCFHMTAQKCSKEKKLSCTNCSNLYLEDSIDFINLVVCSKCGSLRKIDHSQRPNFFEILGQERCFKVDLQSIINKTKQLQKTFHPDLYSQKSSDQQNLSQEYSSLINKALSTLSDPIERGRYLLTLSSSSEEESDSELERTMTSDPEFLEEVMELNEKLTEVSSEDDWKTFRNENVETMKAIHGELEKAFEGENLTEARRLLGRLKYYDTLQYKLKDLQSRIGVIE